MTNICTFCGAVVVVAVVSVVDVGRRSRFFFFKSRHSDLSGKKRRFQKNGVAEMKFTNKDSNIFIDIYFYDDLWAHYLACSHCRPQPLTFETFWGG